MFQIFRVSAEKDFIVGAGLEEKLNNTWNRETDRRRDGEEKNKQSSN